METEQIVGIYRILEKERTITEVALWSCFFDYKMVSRMLESDDYEDSMALKESSQKYFDDHKKTDQFCNSPVRSKYLSQNYLDNYLFIEAICKNMLSSNVLTKISFCGLRLSLDSLSVLNETLIKNKVVKELTFNYCLLDATLLEAIMPCFCLNQNIEILNLACNGLDDKCSYLIAKIISAQSERRDNVVWSYSLRGELPPDNEYKQGLKALIISHNNFSDILASEMILALRYDQYARSIDLRNNNIPDRWCMEFVKLMKDNHTLTNIDLRENPGFNSKMHRELALALLRNIQSLKAKRELEVENTGAHSEDSFELNSKYIKPEVLTIEIPKKFLKKFSQKIMAIKNKKSSSGRNSITDLEQIKDLDRIPSKLRSSNLSPQSFRSRDSTSKTKPTTSTQSLLSSKMSAQLSKNSLKYSSNMQHAHTQEINLQNILVSERRLEPIGEDLNNESQTSIKQLQQQLYTINKRNSNGAHKKGMTQVSSVEMGSPGGFTSSPENLQYSSDSRARAIDFTQDDALSSLKQKIFEKTLVTIDPCNHCQKCKETQKQFYLSESKGLQLAIENFKLKKVIKEGMNSNQVTQDAISLIYSQGQDSQRASIAPPKNQEQILARMDHLVSELRYLAQQVQAIPPDSNRNERSGRKSKGGKNKKGTK